MENYSLALAQNCMWIKVSRQILASFFLLFTHFRRKLHYKIVKRKRKRKDDKLESMLT